MKLKHLILSLLALCSAAFASAQDNASSSAVMSRGQRTRPGQAAEAATPGVSTRMQQHLDRADDASRPDASVKYMRIIYRELDLDKEERNAALYYPEDLVDGNENLFRIMFRLLAQNKVPAYEFLDGREDFTDANRVKMADLINRFGIMATPAKGFSEKNPVYDVEPIDVPTSQVLAYYIIERWTFDNRTNTMKTDVEAICPVIVADDSSDIAGKNPMFWMKMSDLKPFLRQQYIFTSDDNNVANHTYDDFFTLNMYKGDIYKTRNLRNRTLSQMYNGDPDDMKRAQDSIQNRLDHYADNLWVPTREELIAERLRRDSIAAAADTLNNAKPSRASRSSRAAKSDKAPTRSRTTKRESKAPKKESAAPKQSSNSGSATRSVRNRRK